MRITFPIDLTSVEHLRRRYRKNRIYTGNDQNLRSIRYMASFTMLHVS